MCNTSGPVAATCSLLQAKSCQVDGSDIRFLLALQLENYEDTQINDFLINMNVQIDVSPRAPVKFRWRPCMHTQSHDHD
jgi:hypothetical protein